MPIVPLQNSAFHPKHFQIFKAQSMLTMRPTNESQNNRFYLILAYIQTPVCTKNNLVTNDYHKIEQADFQ
ncbi:hypothetical protein L596_020402 [Steinernema carpocapsae]|uniref:Uncharacterized protein n=1 Tax=Steinernema carpocapsae TaxID=34508 RepID=A0A4U5MTL6_STECR|nr:hypothetical protein L596_020402 [Steinernema carpocapsae]